MAEQLPLKVVIGSAVGPFTIGASIHHVLSRIKSDPAAWSKIHVKYSTSEPLLHPVIVELPSNGLRLNFDPAEQRLRFIEVLDFSKVKLQHGDTIINKNAATDAYTLGGNVESGPDFKRVYKEFGPANPGEFVGEDGNPGIYCISFKEGIAFLYPVEAPEGFSKRDLARQIAVLDSTSCRPATSMVVFQGRSWPLARKDIYTADMSHLPLSPVLMGRREGIPAEVDSVRVHDRGRIELLRRDATPFMLRLGETTQQDLLTELGPPDSIFPVEHTKTALHKRRTSSMNSRRSAIKFDADNRTSSSETDGSDAWSDEDDDMDETTVITDDHAAEDAAAWWNYYSHGFDVLISQAQQPPVRSPTSHEEDDNANAENQAIARNHLTATKLCVHGNIPGSSQFNRHRRLRWTLESWPAPDEDEDEDIQLTSETKFRDLQTHLRAVFAGSYETPLEERTQQEPQAFNHDWGGGASSLGNSVELLGGFEEGGKLKSRRGRDGESGSVEAEGEDYSRIGEVLVFGFPGLAFEVLKNGCVSWVQVW